MYIGVLLPPPPPLNTANIDNHTNFAQHQLTQHHNCFPPNSSTKLFHQTPPIMTIMTIYDDKAKAEPLLNHVILTIGMPKDEKFHKLYTRAVTNVTLVLLQHPKSIQIIIGALIYSHASHCLSTRDILSRDKLIIMPSYQTLSRILFTDHNFTTNISYSPLTTAISCLPGIHPCAHERYTLYERHSHTRGPPN